MRHLARTLSILIVASACGGGGEASSDTAAAAPDAATPAVDAAGVSFDETKITPQMIALGDSLFHGLIGATSCQACHGADAKQATVAPDLTDGEWLHSDGSLKGIYETITTGVMSPKKFSSVMPPYGGAPMTPQQTIAVAAYVYKLGHP